MKIVTYNVNGLRQRVSQHGSLLKLLNSLDADIICLQETKLQRQDLSVDVTMAEGYEAFVSCTRTSCKGRLSYSGVATFCRVKSAFSTEEAALPLAAEEGFTGLLESQKRQETVVNNFIAKTLDIEGLEHTKIEDILKVDSEGRCIITDHGHFVLFNLYGPRADDDDKERTRFKFLFFKLLQRRWESLLSQGKRVVVVGDLNIAPAAIDRCDAEPEFMKNMILWDVQVCKHQPGHKTDRAVDQHLVDQAAYSRFRTWLRSMLRECDGPFVDAFRSKHPYRKDAYTCFSPRIGAEEFNYGSRIDHILIAGPCLHGNLCLQHNLFDCHVEGCDIMLQFLRGKFDGRNKWNGGRSIKLQGSDHIPVYVTLNDMPNLPLHSTPALAVRYVPEVHGRQQTIVSFLRKRHVSDANENSAPLNMLLGGSDASENVEGSVASWDNSISLKCGKVSDSAHFSFDFGQSSSEYEDHRISKEICTESNKNTASGLANERNRFSHNAETSVKKVRNTAYSQLTLKSFFHKQKPSTDCNINKKNLETSLYLYDNGEKSDKVSHGADLAAVKNPLPDVEDHVDVNIPERGSNVQDQADAGSCFSFKTEKTNMALLEWQRIQQKMKVSIPLCKGHSEPCVARLVKKEGPNIGQRFYVCARAQGPTANPEANCGHFEWANKRSKHRK